ncbi:carbohydrate kinase [soil metagenome]
MQRDGSASVSRLAPAVVIGEALVDVVDGIAIPGGSPLNVAVGLARLGLPTALATRFGDDEYGRLIAEHLAASGVSLTPGSVDSRPTGVAEATIAADGSASYRFAIDWDPAEVVIADAPALVHTGSIGATLAPGAALVERLLRDHRDAATISYDPNARPQLMGDPADARVVVERLIGLADVVKASDEDVAWLYPDSDVDSVLAGWLAHGPAMVVLTRGGDGADALAASGHVHVDAPATHVADTIGAGDSFMAGLLAALADRDLLGGDRRDALRGIDTATLTDVVSFAARCAAITVSREGANPPSRDELAG